MSVITAHNLSKTYILKASDGGEFHAIKNASFQVNEGESVGIIGRNGAGKSTLLKLLSGITLPSDGNAKIAGSFSSLLEVGTGFHPDLSGRDNIYLNATILGISKKDVAVEINEIIAFSGVDKFIDQPLRTYSSGMKLRLAFSIIAHLKTDIIALDEVLTVGDSMFQIKCLERIFDFKKQGRTLLFVSHNLSAVKKLCERTLVLSEGKIVFDGPTEEAIRFYSSSNGNSEITFSSQFLKKLTVDCIEKSARLQIEIANLVKNKEVDLGINISTQDGTPLYHFSNRFIGKTLISEDGNLELELKFEHQLKPGNYTISFFIGQNETQLDWVDNAGCMIVPPYNPYGFHNPATIQGPIISDFDITKN